MRDISWDDVFALWQVNEGSNPEWTKVATEVKGWPDWHAWRMFTANQLRLPARQWKLFEAEHPMDELPAMLVGPYSGWQRRLPTPNTHTFMDLINIPEQYEHFASNPQMQKMIWSFPSQSVLTALRRPDGKIICVEGHHRATAVAMAKHDGQVVHFPTMPHVAMADLSTEDAGLLDSVLQRGTTKTPPPA